MKEGVTHKKPNEAKLISVKLGNLPHYQPSTINYGLFTKQTHFLLLKSAQSVKSVVAILQNEPNFQRFQPKNKDRLENEPNSNPFRVAPSIAA